MEVQFLYFSGAPSALDDVMHYQSEEYHKNWKMSYVRDIEPSIKTATKMFIILKTLMKLEKRETNVYIDLQSLAIKYMGSDTVTDRLQALLMNKLLEFHQMTASSPDTDIACPVKCVRCFTPLICGHPYCHKCLLQQMEVVSQSKLCLL